MYLESSESEEMFVQMMISCASWSNSTWIWTLPKDSHQSLKIQGVTHFNKKTHIVKILLFVDPLFVNTHGSSIPVENHKP